MDPLPRAALFSVAAVIFVVLAAPMALAQVPQPSLTLTLAEGSVDLGASNSTTFAGSVTYADTAPALPGGAADGNVDLTVTAPAGWTVTTDPASFTLSPGQTGDFTVTIVAPAATETTTVTTEIAATATAGGGRSASATAPLSLTVTVPPPPPAPWYQTSGGIAGIVGAIVLVLAAILAAIVMRRNKRLAAEKAAREAAEKAAYMDRETGITIELADGPLQYGHKREVVYRIALRNNSQRPRVALVEIVSVTNGWRAATQVAKVPLSVGDTQPVTLVVTPDAVITPGDRATVILRTRPEEARERDERITIDVVAPKAGVPADPHYKIVSVHREGAGQPTLPPR